MCGKFDGAGRLNRPRAPGRAGLALLATQFAQRVLQRLDQPLYVLGRHLNPGGRDRQAGRCLGRVLESDERLAALDASANAGELEQGCRSHGAIVAWKKPARGGRWQ